MTDEKPKHKPQAKHTLSEVLNSLQDLIRNDLPAAQTAATTTPPAGKAGAAPPASGSEPDSFNRALDTLDEVINKKIIEPVERAQRTPPEPPAPDDALEIEWEDTGESAAENTEKDVEFDLEGDIEFDLEDIQFEPVEPPPADAEIDFGPFASPVDGPAEPSRHVVDLGTVEESPAAGGGLEPVAYEENRSGKTAESPFEPPPHEATGAQAGFGFTEPPADEAGSPPGEDGADAGAETKEEEISPFPPETARAPGAVITEPRPEEPPEPPAAPPDTAIAPGPAKPKFADTKPPAPPDNELPVLEEVAEVPESPPLPLPEAVQAREIAIRVIARLNIERRRAGETPLDIRTIERLQQYLAEALTRRAFNKPR